MHNEFFIIHIIPPLLFHCFDQGLSVVTILVLLIISQQCTCTFQEAGKIKLWKIPWRILIYYFCFSTCSINFHQVTVKHSENAIIADRYFTKYPQTPKELLEVLQLKYLYSVFLLDSSFLRFISFSNQEIISCKKAILGVFFLSALEQVEQWCEVWLPGSLSGSQDFT